MRGRIRRDFHVSFIMLMDLRLFLNCFSTQYTVHLQFIKRAMCAPVLLLEPVAPNAKLERTADAAAFRFHSLTV